MKKIATTEWIARARKTHGDKYDYSKSDYNTNRRKICIICPIHGEFWQYPSDHLSGCGCPKCKNKKKLTTDEFVSRARETHCDKYDYSKTIYVNSTTKIKIICPLHGEFEQMPKKHLAGNGCPKCANNFHYTTEEWIARARKTHGDKYDYSKSEYVNRKTDVCIICPIHGEFRQNPLNHLKGHCCPLCNSSHLENDMRNLLSEHNIRFEEQKKFDWLKDKGYMRLDFYLPDFRKAIECQGIQHFETVPFFKTSDVSKLKRQDELKRKLCTEHNIHILYYSTLNIEFPYRVIQDTDELINELKS